MNMNKKQWRIGLWGKSTLVPIFLLALLFASAAFSVRAEDTVDTQASSTPAALDTTEDTATSTAPLQLETDTDDVDTGSVANTTGGTIITGDATASTTVDNELNESSVNPDSPGETNSSSI